MLWTKHQNEKLVLYQAVTRWVLMTPVIINRDTQDELQFSVLFKVHCRLNRFALPARNEMKKMRLISITLLSIAFTNSFLHPPIAIAQDKPPILIPLQVGNTWSYTQTETDKSGKSLGRIVVSARVVADQKIGSKHWFKYQEFGDDFWIRNGPGGQFEAVLEDDETSPGKNTKEILYYRTSKNTLPFKYELEYGDMTLISKSKSVSTKAGKFKCYHYQLVESDLKIDMFIAPGKGLIKHRYEDESSVKTSELKSMTLKMK